MEKRVLKCFISSPGDCKNERKACSEIFNLINRGLGDQFKIILEPLMWEYDVIPDMGNEAQKIIDKDIGDRYEIFIGVMFKRFGTPTKEAGSGTEQEFNNAYNRSQEIGKKPKILFYFNDEQVALSSVDFEQYIKVKDFKEKLQGLGLYWMYNGEDDFRKNLQNHLELYIRQIVEQNETNPKIENQIFNKLEKRLKDALKAYSKDPSIWIEPILSNTNKISTDPSENYEKRIDINSILLDPKYLMIQAPHEFGQTCLSHYLILEAYKKNKLWIYVDSETVKPHNIRNYILNEIKELNSTVERLNCIVLDSWDAEKAGALKKLKAIIDEFPIVPIIVMQAIDNSAFNNDGDNIQIERNFSTIHLLAMPQNQIREFVKHFNKIKSLGADDEVVLKKVSTDLEVLNLHRTTKNCLTILKAAQKHFDESPVNRTKFIEIVLSVIFEEYEVPTYKQKKPDLKDCEFVLGKFAETLIRSDNYEFTKDFFLSELDRFCKESLIDLDINHVFDILCINSILSIRDNKYFFKSAFWLFYFAARQMYLSEDFCNYIFKSKKYVSFPEIIEFYTGIDRNRKDALQILLVDLNETNNLVEQKVGLPENMNPFDAISWEPKQEEISEMRSIIGESVVSSFLPDIVKDKYDDKKYNQIRPYNQEVRTILEKYSLIQLMNKLKATSRALRNTDYTDKQTKQTVLAEIVRGWNQLTNVLFALAPVLAEKGFVSYEGAGFVLSDNFGQTKEERLPEILMAIPKNVVEIFKDDLYSSKLSPLIIDRINTDNHPIRKHELVLMLISERPNNWKSIAESYIASLHKNSFFLSDLATQIGNQFHYNCYEINERRHLEILFKMCLAKHEFGSKKPAIHEINKIPSEILRRDSTEPKK